MTFGNCIRNAMRKDQQRPLELGAASEAEWSATDAALEIWVPARTPDSVPVLQLFMRARMEAAFLIILVIGNVKAYVCGTKFRMKFNERTIQTHRVQILPLNLLDIHCAHVAAKTGELQFSPNCP